MSVNPTSIQSGFARSRSEALFPRLFPDAGWWCPSLNPPGGTRLHDLSGRQNWGTLTGMANDDWVVSGGRGALDFDGVNDHVAAKQVYTVNSISISTWSQVSTGSTQFGYIVDLSTGVGVAAGIGTNSDATQVRWVLNDGSNISICDLAVSNPANTMSHWLGTWNGSTAIFYLNGVQMASATSTRILSTAAQNIYIARLFSANRYVLGKIDDVRIYSRALSASEVRQIYRLGRGNMPRVRQRRYSVEEAGFKAYWANRRSRIIGAGI